MSTIDRSSESSPERLQNLHAASLRLFGLLTAQHPEQALLQQAIESLAGLIGARYGAIGVLDEVGGLVQFVHTGITPEEAARIARLPEGKGLLGVVIHENHALRLDDMGKDLRAAGFPPHHPPMKSLLAVPVSHEDQVYGRVYLSEKKDGASFTASDEQLVTRFAEVLALALHLHRNDKLFHRIAHSLSASTGESFFRELTTGLCETLHVDYAFVGKVSDHDARIIETLSFCERGTIVDNIEYQLAPETVCGSVECKTACYFPEGAQQLYPEDEVLREFRAESFVGHPLHDSAGKLLGLLVVMHQHPLPNVRHIQSVLEICATRAAAEIERRQTQSERLRLASAVEQTADSVLITDAKGIVQYVNPAYEKTTGYTQADAIGKKPNLVKSGHHDAAFYERLWSTILRGESFRDVLVNRRKNGELYYEEKTITPIKNAEGRITHFVSTGKDITERKRAEEALARATSEWTYAMDFIEDALYLIGLDDKVVRANRAFYRLTGLTPEQALGHDIAALMHPRGEPVPCPVCTARRERRDARVVMEADHPDNPTSRPIEVTVHIVRDREDAPVSVLMGIHDLSRARQMENDLRRSQVSLLAAQRMARLGDWDWDLVGGALAWSDEIFRIFGHEPQQFVPTAAQFIEAVHPDDRERVETAARRAIEAGEPFGLDFRIVRPDGAVRIVHEEAEVARDKAGRAVRMRGTTQDVTETRQTEDKLARLGRILDDSSNEIYVFCAESLRFIQVNRGAQHNLGYTMDELKERTPLDLKTEFTREGFEALVAPLRAGERERINFTTEHRRKDGSDYPVDVQLQLMRHEMPPVFVAIIQDITERKQAEARLSYLAYYDPLTGLPNRARLLERLQQAMLDAGRVNRLVAVMFLDLDRFKVINDTLGHHVGDALLRAIAERLKGCVRPGDIIARLGGDEFTVALANVAHVDDVARVARVARKILGSFAEPFRVERHELFTTTSLGITLYPFDEQDPEGLLKNADVAMYHAKERGRNNFQFFTAELNARAERRLKIENALRTALERNELSLHYQPQVDTKTGRLVGMEALLRWQHPELGSVSPVEFIPVAEETGLILPVGEWVLRAACRQVKAWHATKFSFSKMQVAVNISGKQLRQKEFPDLVRQVLEETKLDPRFLDLELTESLLMEDVETTADAMHMLHDMGVSFSVDDFGTGYSSLAYLKRFPIDILKIDRSFVHDLATDPNDVAIVKTIIAMAHTLGMRVVAEGVETHQQLQFLRSQGCDGSQGYYCSMPLSVAEFSELLADWGRIRQGKCRPAPPVKHKARRRSAAETPRRARK